MPCKETFTGAVPKLWPTGSAQKTFDIDGMERGVFLSRELNFRNDYRYRTLNGDGPFRFHCPGEVRSSGERDIALTTTDQQKPRLFLLSPNFEDAAYPEQRFFCRHSALVEGVIASFPVLEDLLDIRRIDFKRPRAEVVALVGEANQALPVLILRSGETSGQASGEAGGRQFVAGAEPIIAALVERELIPPPHP